MTLKAGRDVAAERAPTQVGRVGEVGPGGLAELVDAARKGDRHACEDLVRRTWASTYTLAYRRTLRALPRFRGEARFSTWLYRVTANCAASHRSRASRRAHDPLGSGLDEGVLRDRRPEHNPESAASRSDDRALLMAALVRLPPALRQMVVLRDIYDLPHRAIAAELGISEAAAKVRLQRARQRLRDDIGGRLGRPGRGTGLGAQPVVIGGDDAVAS